MKKIVHYNTAIEGGAFEAASDIFYSILNSHLYELKFYTSQSISKRPLFYKLTPVNNLINRQFYKNYYKKLKSLKSNLNLELFTLINHSFKYKFKENADAIHLHWIDDWFDYDSFFNSIDNSIPILWSLHDMSPLTGGCHATLNCRGYQLNCNNCPQLETSKKNIASNNFAKKKELLKNKKLHIISSSQEMHERAMQSAIFPKHTRFYKIPLSINQSEITNLDKNLAKKALQIDEDKLIIGFGASDVLRQNKGLLLLLKSLEKINGIQLITFGSPKTLKLETEIPHFHFGYINSQKLKDLFYSVLDIFVMPSVFEPFGLVNLEAMSYGLPIICSKIGGGSETVSDGINGFLFTNNDHIDLRDKINILKNDENLRMKMGEMSKKIVARDFKKSRMARAYINLYRAILE